jgi:hypothetical protein
MAFMHHTHHVLDEAYVPKTPTEIGLFQEMSFLKSISRRIQESCSLVNTRLHVTRIYKVLKHAKISAAAQLSGDTLLMYNTSAPFPGNWRGTSYVFVFHWKEQVAHYEKLEMEEFPPKHQKLQMLQNAVGDVTDLANAKQLADAYGFKTDKECVNTLEDNICEQGAMDHKLIIDWACTETSLH